MLNTKKTKPRYRRNRLRLAEAQLKGSEAILDGLDLQFSYGNMPAADIRAAISRARYLHAQALANLSRHYLNPKNHGHATHP